MHPECAHCGAALPPGVLYALACALQGGETVPHTWTPPVPQRTTSPTASLAAQLGVAPYTAPSPYSTLRPWLAAILSLLCGLGQLYNGQISKGILLLCSGIVTGLMWHFWVAKVFAVCLWGYAMVDAYVVARRMLMDR